jgi:RimJ/RimL family protein N-acetyltransferase
VNNIFQVPGETLRPFRQIEVELAFAFGKAYWGQSLAYEACLALVDYAFKVLRLPRLVGSALVENHRSVRLQRRLEFKVSRNAHPDHPGWWVTVLKNPHLTHDENLSSP